MLNIEKVFAVHHFEKILKSLMDGVFWQLSPKFGKTFKAKSLLKVLLIILMSGFLAMWIVNIRESL
jgi:hypothetical protein